MNQPPYTHLRRSLVEPPPAPSWPAGTRLQPFEPERHAEAAHALLLDAYAQGGGRVGSFEEWWTALRSDPEYDPEVFLLSVDRRGAIIGLAQCWTSAFLKDLAVIETWRRRGVGRALVLHAFTVFHRRGAPFFDLKVEIGNPSGADRLYRRLGMVPVVPE